MGISTWIREKDAKMLRTQIRIVNLVLYVTQIVAAFTTILSFITFDLAGSMISVYAIIFALIFLVYECRIKSMEPALRRNVGFLYSYRGQAALYFFMGLLNIGMNSTLGIIVGALMVCMGVLLLLLMYLRPDFSLRDDKTDKGGMDFVQTQIAKNPTAALKVISNNA